MRRLSGCSGRNVDFCLIGLTPFQAKFLVHHSQINYVAGMAGRSPSASKFQLIREWNGRQDRAFEELCFQLRDPTPEDAELIKTGAPDAGVEWYWRWPDGAEEGWQVKFIFATDDLLDAMRRSLKSAADKRVGLRALTFCIPWDLPDDPSGASGTQARQRFDEAKTRWAEFAPHVKVGLLSGGELLDRLAREEHRGREWFFFNERVLGADWCGKELKYTIDDAGDRYTPQQNVALPVDQVLEAVALPKDLKARLGERLGDVLHAGRELLERENEDWDLSLSRVQGLLARLEAETLVGEQPPSLTQVDALSLINDLLAVLGELREELQPIGWPPQSEEKADDITRKIGARKSEAARALDVRARKVEDALWSFRSLLGGDACQAAEHQALFVKGPAGGGKTHLFCDVAERLLAAGHPVVAILGERFRDTSPWRKLAELLGDPSLGPTEVAQVLAASGEASGRRAVLLIDALNESVPASMWATELVDIRRRLTESGWVGFAVSCRTTYLDVIEPPGGSGTGFPSVEHVGYREREFEAIEQIFALHGLEQPRVPLLLPEFSNPLFLKLYCEGLQGETGSPQGAEHLSAVFRRFVEARSKRVEVRLKLDRKLHIVEKAISAFSTALAKAGEDSLDYESAAALINSFTPQLQESPNTLLQAMVSEGLLAIDRGWRASSDAVAELVSFPYQRFSDHLIVNEILSSIPASTTPSQAKAALGPGGSLGSWLTKAPAGLVEALAVQLPERWGIEIIDLLSFEPTNRDFAVRHRSQRTFENFLSSITLRERSAFGDRLDELVDEGLRYYPKLTIDCLITVAPDPDHPLNAYRVHDYLAGMSMADRDGFWTMLIYDSFGYADAALDRLIRWAARGPYEWADDGVVELTAIAIAWVFASPNRFTRDYATKALASLLIGRRQVHLNLIERFAEVDDPYVTQRLAAVLLGAISRGPNTTYDRKTATELLDVLVSSLIDAAAIPDLEARDYVASLARWFRRRKLIAPKLLERASPPYGSRPPKTPRRASFLEATYPEGEEFGTGYGLLLSSALSSHSDWSRYLVSGVVRNFRPTKLGEPLPPEKPPIESAFRLDKRVWTKFERSLSPEQIALYDSERTSEFVDSLTPEQSDLFTKAWVPRRRRSGAYQQPMAFPPERANRFIFQRAVELGWTPELFEEFDQHVGRHSPHRSAHKRERFGKKYQWIARNELLARLADNFVMQEWRMTVPYRGAWQLRARSLDPTLPPERIEIGAELETERKTTFPVDRAPTWWVPAPPSFEEPRRGAEGEWAKVRDDLPLPEELLRVVDPQDRRWVIIDGHHSWQDDPRERPSITPPTGPHRDLSILSAGMFIHSRDLSKLEAWLSSNPDLARALPDWGHQNIFQALWAEMPAESDMHDISGRWRWPTDISGPPVQSAPVSLGYLGESGGRDCSISDSINVELPSRFLVEEARLEWCEPMNCWIDTRGREFARYRETDEGFNRDWALMVEEERLKEFLRASGLALAVGLFCERRVFDELGGGIPKALGWIDYAGHVTFDSANWVSAPLAPVGHHGASAEKDDSPSDDRIRGDDS
jgi:hypothetical protein